MLAQEKEIKVIGQLFFHYGVKSLSMDGIAQELRISKKSLYEKYGKKEDLVEVTINNFVDNQKKQLHKIRFESVGPIQELLTLSKHVSEKLSMVPQPLIWDLKKYYNKSWQILYDFYYKFLFHMVKTNIEHGIKEGVYQQSIKSDFTAALFLGTLRMLIREEVFVPHFSSDSADAYMKLLLMGMTTQEGLEVFENV